MTTTRFVIATVVGLATIVLIGREVAGAEKCLGSVYEVRTRYPGAWPSWRGRSSDKCWYPAAPHNHHVRLASRVPAVTPAPRSKPDPMPPMPPMPPWDDWDVAATTQKSNPAHCEPAVRLFTESMARGLEAERARQAAAAATFRDFENFRAMRTPGLPGQSRSEQATNTRPAGSKQEP